MCIIRGLQFCIRLKYLEKCTFRENKSASWLCSRINRYECRHDISCFDANLVEGHSAEAVALHDLTSGVRCACDVHAFDEISARLVAYPKEHRNHQALRFIESDDDGKL
jgi:hypothetical protein